MKFERKDGVTLTFSFKDDKLKLSEFKDKDNSINNLEHDCFVKIKPLNNYNILSVKKQEMCFNLKQFIMKKTDSLSRPA